MSRLVAVSNRMASALGEPAPGGLAVALGAALRERGGLWFGWSGEVAEAAAPAPRLRDSAGVSHATLDLGPDEYAGFYLGYCNGVLWPLCHGLDAEVPGVASHYARYRQVNRRYAAALRPLLRPDDLVWVHDYHLLPLGRVLRDAGVTQPIGFFLHVPFPEQQAWQGLPAGAALLESLLAYDLLGFQTAGDLAAFRRAAQSQWGPAALTPDGGLHAAGRSVALGVFPIGIDVDAVAREAQAAQDSPLLVEAGAARRRGTLLCGADRLERSKGLYERGLAYEAYLALPDGQRQRACLMQVVVPPRLRGAVGAPLAAALQSLAIRINARYACADGPALRHVEACLPHAELMGLLRAAHVGLVTPLRDGMNLVAKEFIAAQDPADPGVLVLSSFAGAARELAAAIQVDPRDAAGTAEAIRRAGAMPLEERRARHREMLAVLRINDLRAWHTRFLERLLAGRATTPPVVQPFSGRKPRARPPARYRSA